MIEQTYRVLGYHRLLDRVSYYASCPLGRSNCLSLKPSNDSEFIDSELRLVLEMRLLLKVKGFVSLSELTDILPGLKKSRAEGSCLEPNELLCILRLADACRQSKEHLRAQRSLCPRMYYDLSRVMPDCKALAKRLMDTISSSGEVKDSASPALKKIRVKKSGLRSDLQRKLEDLQKPLVFSSEGQDQLVTVRDGRYVIATRTSRRSRIEGIIHGYSQTRATCFLEPVKVIRDNNRIAELAQEEKEEEVRILTGLTDAVRDRSADLQYSQFLIGKLDGLYARARFSEAMSCVMPEMSQKNSVKLKGAKNPILLALALDSRDKKKKGNFPVPVDIVLDSDRNVLIISGPNRGGKTVTLKTLGLINLMAQAGIHIPAEEGSCLPVFNQIMAEIGDEQDIQTGFSTFSAHVAHLKHIIEHADRNSLVIIDEPGMGTDPDEGVALAMAVLDSLSQKGTFVAVSTHSNRLKSYGLLNQQAINVSVEFDKEKNRPTFRLKYGAPGISYALEIARDMGVPSSILDRARGYLDKGEVHLSLLIEKLNRLMLEANREKRKAEEAKKNYQAYAKKMDERLTTLEEEKMALMEGKRLEAETAIREAREELKQAVNLLKRSKESVQAYVSEKFSEVTYRLMGRFERDSYDRGVEELKDIKEAQVVFHKELRRKGIVQSVDPSGQRIQVMLGNMKISAKVQDLEVLKEVPEFIADESLPIAFGDLKRGLPKELNVIGYRVDDAISLIDKIVNRAVVEGDLSLKIIHGFGTGRLREAIRAHLKEVPFVKNIRSADQKFGGDAITVVEL